MARSPSDILFVMPPEVRDLITETGVRPHLKKVTAYGDLYPGSRGTRRHPSTWVRYCNRGVRLPDGTVLRLRALRVGATWLTTDDWVAEFVAAQTAAHAPAPPTGTRTPGERDRASHAAAARLKELGL